MEDILGFGDVTIERVTIIDLLNKEQQHVTPG